jgi:hypothetical protein
MNVTEPVTVIETPSFLRDGKKLLDNDEREALVNYLAYNPNAGVLISGTGGIRKIRWAREDERNELKKLTDILHKNYKTKG